MKLLSIGGIVHDTNLTYFDGEKVHYMKLERILQRKGFGYNQLSKDNMHISDINVIYSMLLEIIKSNIEKFWGVKIEDIDAVVTVNRFLNFPLNINHHLAHALSVSFLYDVDKNIAIDAKGGHYYVRGKRYEDSWRVYYGDKLKEIGIVDMYGSIGAGVNSMCLEFEELQNTDIKEAPGKLMGLVSYGNVNLDYLNLIQKYSIYDIEAKLVYETDKSLGAYRKKIVQPGSTIFSIDNYKKFLGVSNLNESQKLDWARTVHEKCGEIILDLFRKHVNPEEKVGYSGGVAQNIIWNTKIKKEFPNLFVVPYASDEGLSIGGMEFLRRKFGLPKLHIENFPYGTTDEAPTTELDEENIKKIASFLANGKSVALYQGHGEIGPRALGNRSILFDPRIENGRDIINNIKKREKYRPFGASVLTEHKHLFGLDYENPYMLYVGYPKIHVPSITHVDGTCRVQTVAKDNSAIRKVLECFYEQTGCPVLLNTSLNIAGKPIAGNIDDAISEFENKSIDLIAIGNIIKIKGISSVGVAV